MSSNRSSCIRHKSGGLFFVLYEDYLEITGYHYAQAAALRVLETKTDDRLTYLREKEQETITDEDLWITLDREDFEQRSLKLYDGRSYHDAIPPLEQSHLVHIRYIKLDENGKPLKDEHARQLLVYCSIQEARRDKAHPGLIVKQYRLDYRAVNKKINELEGGDDQPPPPPPPAAPVPPPPAAPPDGSPPPAPSSEEGDPPVDSVEAREGNLRAHTEPTDEPIIAEPLENFPEQGTNGIGTFSADYRQIFPAPLEETPMSTGNSSDYKNLSRESFSSRISEESAAARADGAPVGAETIFFEKKFLGDGETERLWSREAILNLAAVYLPALPTNRRKKQLQEDAFNWDQAAKHVFEGWTFRQLATDEERINHLVRLLLYMTTPSSPCSWQQFMRQRHPDAPIRLWHVANNAISMSMEMEQFGWWPVDTGQGDPFLRSHEQIGGADRERETGELVSLGMCEVEADELMAVISRRCPDWGVRKRRLSIDADRWRVDFSADRQKAAYVYRRQDWSAGWQRDPEGCWAAFRRRLDTLPPASLAS